MIRTGRAAGKQTLPSAFLFLDEHIWSYFHHLLGVAGRREPGSPYFQQNCLASFLVYLSSILMMITVL